MTNTITGKDIVEIVKDAYLLEVDKGLNPVSIEFNEEMFKAFREQTPMADELMKAGWVLNIDTPNGKLPVKLNGAPDAKMCNIISEEKKTPKRSK